MFIRRLRLERFGNHRHTDILLSPGVNLFLGTNGAGKSLIGDAVCWVLYGRGIRDRGKWKPDSDTSVLVEFDDGTTVERSLCGGVTALRFNDVETNRITEIQDLIDIDFGSLRFNRVTRFFHRSNAARFSLAADGERKRIIEQLIGVERFDECYSQLKAERIAILERLTAIDASIHELRRKKARLGGILEGLRVPEKPIIDEKTLEMWRKASEKPPDRPKLKEAASSLEQYYERYRAAEAEYRTFCNEYTRRETLIRKGRCSHCGAVTNTNAAKAGLLVLKEETAGSFSVYQGCAKDYERAFAAYTTLEVKENERYSRDREVHYNAVQGLEKYNAALGRYESRRVAYASKFDRCTNEMIDCESMITNFHSERFALEFRQARVFDLMQVYGSKGARVIALRSAFRSISRVGTDVLGAVGWGKMSKALLSVDASEDLSTIRLGVVLGAYVGPYGGLSQGEQAVFDFALLKALGSIPWNRARGMVPLLYDDILEALDYGHKVGVCEYLRGEGDQQQVIVFTHDDSVVDLLYGSRVFTVVDGAVSC